MSGCPACGREEHVEDIEGLKDERKGGKDDNGRGLDDRGDAHLPGTAHTAKGTPGIKTGERHKEPGKGEQVQEEDDIADPPDRFRDKDQRDKECGNKDRCHRDQRGDPHDPGGVGRVDDFLF